MADPLSAISTAIELVGKLRELSKQIREAEVKMLIADLSIALADAKMEVADLKNECLKLREQVAQSSTRSSIRQHVEYRGGLVYLEETAASNQGRPVGPYCPACLDLKETLTLLKLTEPAFRDVVGKWTCPACKQRYSEQ